MRQVPVPLLAAALTLGACGGPANGAIAPATAVVQPASPTPPAPEAPRAIVNEAPREDDAAVPITSADPTWGSRTALATVVFFGDFQCPFTGRATRTIAALEEKYGPRDVRI